MRLLKIVQGTVFLMPLNTASVVSQPVRYRTGASTTGCFALEATPPGPEGTPSGLRSEPGPGGTPSASGLGVAPNHEVTVPAVAAGPSPRPPTSNALAAFRRCSACGS